MKEYVKKKDEFAKLTKGRIHWIIYNEPQRIGNIGGSGIMNTGEYRLVLSVSGISKDKPKRVVVMKMNFGIRFANQPEYAEKIKEIEEFAKEHFPKATEGAFE